MVWPPSASQMCGRHIDQSIKVWILDRKHLCRKHVCLSKVCINECSEPVIYKQHFKKNNISKFMQEKSWTVETSVWKCALNGHQQSKKKTALLENDFTSIKHHNTENRQFGVLFRVWYPILRTPDLKYQLWSISYIFRLTELNHFHFACQLNHLVWTAMSVVWASQVHCSFLRQASCVAEQKASYIS